MPLLITPSAPLSTPCGLPVASVYCIINHVSFDRIFRRGAFEVGYYVEEAASLPDSGVQQLPVNLPRGFSFSIQPAQADALASPQDVCEAYAMNELLQVLPAGTVIDTVA